MIWSISAGSSVPKTARSTSETPQRDSSAATISETEPTPHDAAPRVGRAGRWTTATRHLSLSASWSGKEQGMRFNHMELTFPVGTLTAEFREELDAFYASVFGWSAL